MKTRTNLKPALAIILCLVIFAALAPAQRGNTRCPSAVPQPPAVIRLPTPNDNFGADAMTSQMAHMLSAS